MKILRADAAFTAAALGWSRHAERFDLDHEADDPRIGRVIGQHRGHWEVATGTGPRMTHLSGTVKQRAKSAIELPVVGDWVELESAGQGPWILKALLPRRGLLVRATTHGGDGQPLVANLDVVFVMTAADRDFSQRRLERWLALVWESGAEPVVLLNKSDLGGDLEFAREMLSNVAPNVPVLSVSALTGAGLEELESLLVEGAVGCVVGSSGVGKSTLVNRWLGHALQATAPLHSGGRGRHITSARVMHRLPGGGFVVDTPGLREVGLFEADEGLVRAFVDLESLAEGCRFSDCKHETEPGCAVLQAVEDDEVEIDRLEAWRNYRAELRAQEGKTSVAAREAYLRSTKSQERLLRSRLVQKKR